MDFRNYFNEAQDEANENFFHYDGYNDDDFDFVDDDGYDEFEGDDDDDYDNAVGGISAPTSQPYIVVVKNTSTATAYPCTLLGAYSTLSNSSPNWQNNARISISMGITGITYQEFLYQSMSKNFTVGLTYYQSSTANQVLESLTLIQKDVNGNESQKTLVPTLDPYQQLSTVIAIKFSYKVEGFTAVVISSVLANATVKLYFYPSETVSAGRTLTGRRAVRGYGNPHIIKQDKLSLTGKALKSLSRRGRG
jgi:hypothetical protein